MILNFQLFTAELDKIHDESISDFQLIAEKTEGMIHVNKASDFQLSYMNPYLSRFFDRNLEEVASEGVDFLAKRLHPDTTEKVIPYFSDFYARSDNYSVCSAIQRSRPDMGYDYQNLLSSTKIIKDRKEFMTISIPFERLGETGRFFQKEIELEDLKKRNFERFLSLTRKEKIILRHVSFGASNRQIGEELYISEHTVRTHRNRIFSKLGIRSITEAVKFAQLYLD